MPQEKYTNALSSSGHVRMPIESEVALSVRGEALGAAVAVL